MKRISPVPNSPVLSAMDSEFARDLVVGLRARPRSVAPKYFYDAAGSALFDRICELPEYYPTRVETELYARHAGEMAQHIGADADIIEFGAGSVRKIRLLLSALTRPRRFVPIDISGEHLHAAASVLKVEYPTLEIQPIVGDFTRPFALPPFLHQAHRRVGFFPGSSIGNFQPEDALRFLRSAASLLRGGGLLIGVDLVKDPATLHAAYNDAAGVTAAFNRNLLVRANRELGADFAIERFEHYAFYNPGAQRIEMHLLSQCVQEVSLSGERFRFAEGESIHTENSYKYTLDGFRALASNAGFYPAAFWCDPQRLFSVHWLQVGG